MNLKHELLYGGHGESRDVIAALHRAGVPTTCVESVDQIATTDDWAPSWVLCDRSSLASVLTTAARDVAEEALRDSDFRYEQLFEHMHEGVAIQQIVNDTSGTPVDYRILDVNPAWEAIMRRQHEDVAGRLASDVFDGVVPFLEVVGPIAQGAAGTVVDVHFAPLGRDLRMSVFRTHAGQFATVMQDMTAQRQLEEQVHQAQKMEAIGRLAGGIAHDFNNLLTVILGYADMALDIVSPSDPLKPALTEIRASAGRAAALTAGLLAFSRKQVAKQIAVNLGSLVADMLPMLQRVMGEDILFEAELAPTNLVIRADRNQVEQVVMNLVVNARDAMPRGGRLTIATELATIPSPTETGGMTTGLAPGTYAVLVVRDTGTGMDEETMAHLFEPFFTTKPPGKGTGLGLSTVFGIVTQNGADIRVMSEVDLGSTFRVYFPLASGQAETTDDTPEVNERRGGNEVVLVAEDDEAVRRLVMATLTHAGYRVLEAGDGVDALQVSQDTDGPIHLLITDAIMPRMGGVELVGRIREQRAGIGILFLSGYGDDALHELTGSGGAVAMLKPFRPLALLEKTREVLEHASH
jgi:two-component system cell cycle sensor histidine kinase/response regulator CckA